MSNSTIDFRLLELTVGLAIAKSFLQFIEEEHKRTELKRETQLHELQYKVETCEGWITEENILWQDWEEQTKFILPRMLHASFLVALFALYETTVTKIAKMVQCRLSIKEGLRDKGGGLDRMKEYFKGRIPFKLWKCNQNWERLNHLSKLRNAILHANGRLELMSETLKKDAGTLLKGKGDDKWVYEQYGYILVDRAFLQDTFIVVKDELQSLKARYLKWYVARRGPSSLC